MIDQDDDCSAGWLLRIYYIRDFSRSINMGSSVQAQGAIPPGLAFVVNHCVSFGAVRDWRLESNASRQFAVSRISCSALIYAEPGNCRLPPADCSAAASST
jgi:hypothetical protein